ncbi:MAG: carboxypeptidase-like regulatory domain-containing protein [Gemmatimonadetes bacterium]|nr:carboxypeptidase-like regulatory domain-containing protein [Gemmatimonadota bacterium]
MRRLFRLCIALVGATLVGCEYKAAKFFEPTGLDLSLFTGTITGTVTVNGVGVSGVTVSSGAKTTVTGANGTYQLVDMPVGSTPVGVSGLPANATCPSRATLVDVVAGQTVRADFACTAPTTGSVGGQVTVDGTGTAGMVVSVDGRIATTGPGGVYLIDGVRPGSQTVQVAPPDGGTCSPSARAVTVVAGELVTANFACARPATGSIGGIVTLNGASAVGVTVSAGTRSAVTNAGGVYRIDSVPPGPATVQVGQIDGATCTPSARQVTVVASQIATANFTCTRPTVGTITGTVTLNGTPVAGVSIAVGLRIVTTGANGTYRVDSLPPGIVPVSIVEPPTGATCQPGGQGVMVVAGEVATANFSCTRPTTGSVTGSVSINGTPTAGITVLVGSRVVTTGANGSYRVDSLPPGPITVALGDLPPNTTCQPGTQVVTIVAGQVATANVSCTRVFTGSVAGRVTIDGQPAAGLTIFTSLLSTTTDSNGQYRLDGILPGTAIVAIAGLLPTITCSPGTSRGVLITAGAITVADFTCVRQSAFSLGVIPSYRHLGSTSEVCAVVTTTPAQPNAAYSAMFSGPGVLSGFGSLNGTLSSTGTATLRFGIDSYGTYNGSVTVLGRTTSFTMDVSAAAGMCPQ